MLEQGERLGACFRRRLDEWGRARDKCDVLLWDKVQEAAAGRKGEEPSGSGTTRWKQDAKKAADLDSKMCKHIDEIKDEVGPSSSRDAAMLSTDLDEAMGTAFPDEWRTMHKLVSEWQDGKRDGNGEPAKKARLEDVEEDSQLPCGDEEASGIPLTEASVNSMNEAIAKQDEMRRAKRKDIAERDEVLEKRRKGMPPESGKKEEQEVQGRNPQEQMNRILIADEKAKAAVRAEEAKEIAKEVAASDARVNAYAEQFAARVNAAAEFARQKKDQARGAAQQAQEMGKAKEAQEMGKAKAAETDKKAAETDKKKYEEKSKRQLRETWPTLQDLFTFL